MHKLIHFPYFSGGNSEHSIKAYVKELYKILLEITDQECHHASKTLKDLTPAPISTMLEKSPKIDAIKKHTDRKVMSVVDVPATGSTIIGT